MSIKKPFSRSATGTVVMLCSDSNCSTSINVESRLTTKYFSCSKPVSDSF